MDKKERKIYNKKYQEEKKEKIREQRKKYYQENYQENKEKIKESYRKYYHKNKEKEKARHKKWLKKNPEYFKEYLKKYNKKKYNEDPRFRLKVILRKRLNSALKLYSKTGKIKKSKDYGINYKKIIEALKPFPKDIEKYHIDHVVPLSWFNFNDKKEIKWAFEPENHQWLLINENRKKNNNYMG